VNREAAAAESPRPLEGMRVLVLTSGHEALDARVYGREARSVRAMGATVVVVGKLTRGTPDTVEVWLIPPASNRFARFVFQPWRCLWRGRTFRPDIVHFHDAEMLAILPVARLLWPRAKFVYDVHEDFANLMLIRDWLPRGLKPAARALTDAGERSLARLAHGIVAVTPPLARKFPHRHRISALNFPTPAFFEEASEASRPAARRAYELVHLGTLNRRRAAFLAELVQGLNRVRADVRCLVVGTSPEMIEFLRPRVPQSCELRGPVAHAEVAEILSNAKVGIDVHPWLQPHLEPALAVKICEYMACGTAVVASSMPVLEWLLSRAAERPPGVATVRSDRPADYIDAVVRLLAAIDSGDDPGADLRGFAREHMNWQVEAGQIGSLYRSLVDGTPCVA